ncbi:MAG: hypothetical protein GF317_16990 [Candidatus Lokiarchaeota archaeon]|nr:hypothetical protein [Candidatus Lokiarchaeota archaeon]MBD3201215.1 hypothetical protein [Candidatus Lokiarchaeota archaeon]
MTIILIFLSFLILTLIGKQYILTYCILIILIGFLIGFFGSIYLKISNKKKHLFRFLISIIVLSISIPTGFLARETLDYYSPSQVWKLHEIDNLGILLPNGLDPADVNTDGYLDYVTNYEWDGKIKIAFYPSSGQLTDPWPSITVGEVANAENAAFGDFDGDGNVDIVVAHGEEFNAQPGVFIIWGQESEKQ